MNILRILFLAKLSPSNVSFPSMDKSAKVVNKLHLLKSGRTHRELKRHTSEGYVKETRREREGACGRRRKQRQRRETSFLAEDSTWPRSRREILTLAEESAWPPTLQRNFGSPHLLSFDQASIAAISDNHVRNHSTYQTWKGTES